VRFGTTPLAPSSSRIEDQNMGGLEARFSRNGGVSGSRYLCQFFEVVARESQAEPSGVAALCCDDTAPLSEAS
jgi:hypothetical protein